MPEPGLHVSRFVETLLHQFADSFPRSRPLHRSKKGTPFGRYLGVRRQARHVNEPLCFANRILIEAGDTRRKRVNKSIEFGIWQRAIYISIDLSEVTGDIVRTQKDLEGAPPAHQTWQTGHGSTARHESGADFPLRQESLFAAREPHVAGQRELAPDTSRSPANHCNGYDGRTTDARQHVRQLLKSRGSGSEVDRISWFRKEIVMSQEETVDSAIKHDHLQCRLGFECGDNFVQFRKSFRAEDVERRMIERHSPVHR